MAVPVVLGVNVPLPFPVKVPLVPLRLGVKLPLGEKVPLLWTLCSLLFSTLNIAPSFFSSPPLLVVGVAGDEISVLLGNGGISSSTLVPTTEYVLLTLFDLLMVPPLTEYLLPLRLLSAAWISAKDGGMLSIGSVAVTRIRGAPRYVDLWRTRTDCDLLESGLPVPGRVGGMHPSGAGVVERSFAEMEYCFSYVGFMVNILLMREAVEGLRLDLAVDGGSEENSDVGGTRGGGKRRL